MKVVVTGSCGTIGQVVVARLLDEGCTVVGVDKQPGTIPGARMVVADLCDMGSVYTAFIGADAIIHLGAYPSPFSAPPHLVYSNNAIAQYNVFDAAANLGISRVVNISSVSALGFPFHLRWFEPLYLPIDEDHPLLPQDAYGLSKATGEEIAAAYCRRGAGSAVSLRFSTVISPEEQGRYRGVVEAVRQNPGMLVQDLWSYIDIRDAAEACWLALKAEYEGHHPLYITAKDTLSELPTNELLDRWLPNVPRRPGVRSSRWSLLDNTRAEALIGYSPRYSWSKILDCPLEEEEVERA